ncbi:hypothetical protein FRC11_013681, partial [Ceratobasidium sp. 423]
SEANWDWGKFLEANARDFTKNVKQGWTSRPTVLHLQDIPSDSSSVQEAETGQGSTWTRPDSSAMTKKLKQKPMKSRPSRSESTELSTVITSPLTLSSAEDHDEADIDDYNGDSNGNDDDDKIDDELDEIWEKITTRPTPSSSCTYDPPSKNKPSPTFPLTCTHPHTPFVSPNHSGSIGQCPNHMYMDLGGLPKISKEYAQKSAKGKQKDGEV